MASYDVIVVGAGAAGLFCGAGTALRGLRTLVLDHSKKPAEKIRISGGGRCNFTNIHTRSGCFISANPHYAKSALARYSPQDFMDLMARHNLSWTEKKLGQLFCDQKSGAVIQMLLDELSSGGGELRLDTAITDISYRDGRYYLTTNKGIYHAAQLVIATGGLSIPKIGATSFAYDLAQQFGHDIILLQPALVPFTFEGADGADFKSIAGVAVDVRARADGRTDSLPFDEALLFTHRGLSGPAMLQISSYWSPRHIIHINLFAERDGAALLKDLKAEHPHKSLLGAIEGLWPKRLVDLLLARQMLPDWPRLADISNEKLHALAADLSDWRIKPSGTEGYRTAEVTSGGINTDGLSSKTMESKNQPGLYFIGECVDVTGWLGGYNFQWAWASAHAAAEAVTERHFLYAQPA